MRRESDEANILRMSFIILFQDSLSIEKGGCEKTKKILHATFLQISKAMCALYAMFVNHFGHKGPRLIARPLLMAAFYKFIGRCFRFLLSR